MDTMVCKAVFLDRDGVIIELRRGNEAYGFIYKKEDCHIIEGVPAALAAIKSKDFLIIVVTNQPPIARGLVTPEEMDELNAFINAQTGNHIDRFYVCPHHPEMHPDVPEHAKKFRIVCECRKPSPGMLLQAATDLSIDLTKSWMVGDTITDIAAGKAAGCATVLVESLANNRIAISGKPFDATVKPDYKIKNLLGFMPLLEAERGQ